LRDLDGVLDRLGQIREELGHLGRRAQILLLAVRARSRGIVERDALRDANARLVRLVVAAREEAHVVRRDDGQRVRRRGLDGASEILALAGASQALQLDVEASRQQGLPIVDRFGAARAATSRERLADLAVLAAREAYEPFER